MSDEKKIKPFDLRVHIRDPKTGEIVTKQPYKLVITGSKEFYVRDGRYFNADGSEAVTKEQVRQRAEAERARKAKEEQMAERVAERKAKLDEEKAIMAQLLKEDEEEAKNSEEMRLKAEAEVKAQEEEDAKIEAEKHNPIADKEEKKENKKASKK